MKTYLKSRNFSISEIDPCLFKKKIHGRTLLIGLYVDDLILVGFKQDIKEEIKMIKKKYSIRVKKQVNEFISLELVQKK